MFKYSWKHDSALHDYDIVHNHDPTKYLNLNYIKKTKYHSVIAIMLVTIPYVSKQWTIFNVEEHKFFVTLPPRFCNWPSLVF